MTATYNIFLTRCFWSATIKQSDIWKSTCRNIFGISTKIAYKIGGFRTSNMNFSDPHHCLKKIYQNLSIISKIANTML